MCVPIFKFLYFQSCLIQPAIDEFSATQKKFIELQVHIDTETCQIKDQCLLCSFMFNTMGLMFELLTRRLIINTT